LFRVERVISAKLSPENFGVVTVTLTGLSGKVRSNVVGVNHIFAFKGSEHGSNFVNTFDRSGVEVLQLNEDLD